MAKTKYTPETIKLIIDAIADKGNDEDGWIAGCISGATFYAWQNTYPEFRDKVAIAKREFSRNCPAALHRQKRRAFADYLYGEVEEVWTTEEITVEPDGSETVKSIVKRVKRGPAVWAIRWLLEEEAKHQADILQAFKIFAESGVVSEETSQRAKEGLLEYVEFLKEIVSRRSGAHDHLPED